MYNNCYDPIPCGCTECADNCPIKLDFSCILYNKDGVDASNLDGLGLPNGSTLKLVIELLDEKIKQLNVVNYSLAILRANHTINSLQQFAEAVDVEIGTLKTNITGLSTGSNVAVSANTTSSVSFSLSGTLNHTLAANVRIGTPESANCLTVQSDGLVSVPQTLSINYTTKVLSISKGNSVNLSSLAGSTFLGNVVADPGGAIDGNYWFNTVQGKVKIKVNGIVKEILTA